jgi:hypothetical protein
MGALIPFVAVLSKAPPFGDAVEACKVATRCLLSGFGSRIFKVNNFVTISQLVGLWEM